MNMPDAAGLGFPNENYRVAGKPAESSASRVGKIAVSGGATREIHQ
jgi:hypothetical protein